MNLPVALKAEPKFLNDKALDTWQVGKLTARDMQYHKDERIAK